MDYTTDEEFDEIEEELGLVEPSGLEDQLKVIRRELKQNNFLLRQLLVWMISSVLFMVLSLGIIIIWLFFIY